MRKKDLVEELFLYDYNTNDERYCWIEKKTFYKNWQFSGFSSFSGIRVRFSIKIDDFGFDFHKLSLSAAGIVEVSHNITDSMVIRKLFY